MEQKSVSWWTSGQIRKAIERCNAECARLIACHAPGELIAARRRGIEHLMRLLNNVERKEREAARNEP